MTTKNCVLGQCGVVCSLFLVALLASPLAPAAVWHVDAAQTSGPVDGSTWATAHPVLQNAVDSAAAGDEIWVAAGTYTGTGEQAVYLRAGLTLYGGFTGTETARDQRDWKANVTVIDGQSARRCVRADESGAVDGFTLQNGKTVYGQRREGGGMYGGTATHCVFEGNTADTSGGGMSTGTAVNCVFTGNAARYYGGGMYRGSATNCLFTGNAASASGGGMADGTAVNCTFVENRASSSGGGTYEGTVSNCVIWGNAYTETDQTKVYASYLPGGQVGAGSIIGNPGFVNPWSGDFRLRADSVCVDAGMSNGAPALDLLGRARPQGAGVDIGAYEYHAGDDADAGEVPILRVSAASTAAIPDGLTWETAYPSIQAALDQSGFGAEIWVAAGNYTGTGKQVVQFRTCAALYGGFIGTETAREQRDWSANPTVIDGEGARRCVTATVTSVVDGVTLRNGAAETGGGMYYGMAARCTFSGNAGNDAGGGMHKGTAFDCVFSGNTAGSSGGGGMYESTGSNCIFTGNSAYLGGGISFCTVTNCVFSGNSARNTGGAMNYGTATNCTLVGNSAVKDGGGGRWGTALNCVFYDNTPNEASGTTVYYSCRPSGAWGSGNINGIPRFVNPWAGDFRLRSGSPGIDAGRTEGAPSTDLLGRVRPQGARIDMGAYEHHSGDDADILDASVVRVNAASTAAHPDGLTWETAYSTIQAAVDHAYGADIWVASGTYTGSGEQVVKLGAALKLYGGFAGTETEFGQRGPTATATIIDGQGARRCVTAADSSLLDGFTLRNGKAPSGGGMHKGTAVNCVFTGNRADTNDGGGMYSGNAFNCTFAGNLAAARGGGLYGGTATNCILWGNVPDESSLTTVSFSCLSADTPGAGNVAGTPRFANPWAGDFRLRAGSPCIDTGTAAGAPALDILGRPRPQGAGVDMGACEYHTEDDAAAVDPPILRVSADSTAASPDGMAWETAYRTLQAVADRAGYGAEIWVTAGTYSAGSGNQVVNLLPDTLLYGGFSGTETAREQRDWTTNVTIIDGQKARRCVTAAMSAVVDGFTLQNGSATDGGGMWKGTAANCVFTGNEASNGGGMGGGTAVNCIFRINTATSGGGMLDGTAANCTFTGNEASSGGGMKGGRAINCVLWGNTADETEETEVLYSCLSEVLPGTGNVAGNPRFVNPWAGDFRLRADSPCIDAGTAEDAPDTDMLGRPRPQGAGIDMGAHEYHAGDDAHAVDSVTLRVSTASNAANPDGLTWATAFPTLQEAADRSGYGGEIWVAAGTYTGTGKEVVKLVPGTSLFGGFAGTETVREQRSGAARSTFIDGRWARRCVTANAMDFVDGFWLTNGKADQGAGMYSGRAANCTFRFNNAQAGGGMYSGSAVNCLFVANYAATAGGGMHAGTAVNCTFTGNTGGATHQGTAINCIFWQNGTKEISGTAVSFSSLTAIVPGTGNIVGDPVFADTLEGNYRLGLGSPCMDAGTSLGAPDTDILGMARPQGAGVDMGAYEMQQVPVPDVSGLIRTAARELVSAAQLYVRNETEEYHPTVPADHVMEQHPAAGVPVLLNAPVDLVVSKGPQPVPVPYLGGLARAAARDLVAAAQLYVRNETEAYHPTIPADHVMDQNPAAGVIVFSNTPVDLVLSMGPQPVPVPDLSGLARAAARGLIAASQLYLGGETNDYHPTIPVDHVIGQTPAAGTQASMWSRVNLVISRGVQPSVMPDITGQPRAQAEAAITGAGLALGTVTETHSETVGAGSVISQSPAAGTEVPPGTAASLVVSLGPVPVEGEPLEGEAPEGEPATTDAVRGQLASAIAAADASGDGALSYEESVEAVPGLTPSVFAEIDTDGDGQLTQEELTAGDGGGCTGYDRCGGGLLPVDWVVRLADLFLMLLCALGLGVLSALRRW